MAKVTDKFLLRGGVLLLLPFIIYSYSPVQRAGAKVGYGLTDNVYQMNIKNAGHIIDISPYFFSARFVQFHYVGDISLTNSDVTNLLVANDVTIAKNILLPGIGNKTAIYLDFYSFYAPAYEQYKFVDIVAGNTLNAYVGKYLFSSETKVRYKYYLFDSLNNYLEPSLNVGVVIPLPYALFTPEIGIGFRNYIDEFVPLYTIGSEFHFPLTLDFTVTFGIDLSYTSRPQNSYIIPIIYADDPFFEEENICELSEVQILATRTNAKKRVFLTAKLSLFRKGFYEIEDLERVDEGLQVSVQFTKFLSDNLGLHINGNSHLNTSTLDEFDYARNEVSINLELIF